MENVNPTKELDQPVIYNLGLRPNSNEGIMVLIASACISGYLVKIICDQVDSQWLHLLIFVILGLPRILFISLLFFYPLNKIKKIIFYDDRLQVNLFTTIPYNKIQSISSPDSYLTQVFNGKNKFNSIDLWDSNRIKLASLSLENLDDTKKIEILQRLMKIIPAEISKEKSLLE